MLRGLYFFCLAGLGSCLIFIRFISDEFVLGTNTFTHPYILFIALLIGAGLVWLALIPLLKRCKFYGRGILWSTLVSGLLFRAIFWDSTPIYENDWSRYLWDGLVVSEGYNPYKYPPEAAYEITPEMSGELQALADLSEQHMGLAANVNYSDLTTIYPPVTMGVFYIAAKIAPADLNGLRGIYLLFDLAGFWLLVRALKIFGRDPNWAALYWLNPMLIYCVYNAGHMDVILVPVLLGAMFLVKTRPLFSSAVLGIAAAIKFWPLLLGPVLLRQHKGKPFVFVMAGFIAGLVALLLTMPMLLQLGENSGFVAYATQWERSSFLFGYLEAALGLLAGNTAGHARISVAVILTGYSIWLTFKQSPKSEHLPRALMALTIALYVLSPTGYPWYVIWFLPFLPFFPVYGAALLTVTTSLYYVRFALEERGVYDFYSNIFVPIQFGLPLLILVGEGIYGLRRRNI